MASPPPSTPVGVSRPHPAGRGARLAVWVSGICLLALVPLLVFSALLLYWDIAAQQRHGLAMLERRAAAAAAAIGHKLDGVFTELTVLSLAEGVRSGDMAAAYGLASRVVAADGRIASISLSGPTGQQPFITTQAFGTRLPDSAVTDILRPLFDGTAERVVAPLVVGAVSKKPVVGVARRIDMGPAGVFALRAVIRLESIGARLNEQGWPTDWTAAIIDQNGVIIARSHDGHRFVGQPATPGLLDKARQGDGPFYATTKSGVATVTSASRVPGSGWYVVVGRPVAALEAQVRDSMATILLAGVLCAALGVGAATVVGRSIGRQLHGVVQAHVRGDAVPAMGRFAAIKEVGEIADALARARDVADKAHAELTAAREQALSQLRERSDMLDVLSHEVRQPLNNASAALQHAHAVIQGSLRPELATHLVRASGVLGEVVASIDNTLAAAALLVGGEHIRRGDVDIDALVGVAIADMPPNQVSRVRVERLTATRTASMEPNLMRLALRNLVSNALKFSAPDTTVTVRISDSDEPLAVVVDVVDAGPGIDEALLPRLFDRGDRRQRHPGGRRQGLGLYIVRRVMQLHGGSVSLERNTPDGTTMRLVIVQGTDD